MRAVLSSIVGLLAAALAAPAMAGCTLAKVAELPVTMDGLRGYVDARINGQPARLALDTGAFFSSVTLANALKYGLAVTPPPAGMGVIEGVGGKRARFFVARVKDLVLGEGHYPNVDVIVLPGGADAGEAGLLGQNVFEKTDVEFDLADGVMRSFVPQNCGAAPLAYWAGDRSYSEIAVDPVTPVNAQIIGEVVLNGVRLRAGFDSGSPNSIISTRAAALAGVVPGAAGVKSAGDVSGLGRDSYLPTWKGTFASLKIGGEEMKNFELLFGDINIVDGGIDMLIGADFFLSHRILVANSQHRMYFTYNGGPVFNVAEPEEPGAAGPHLPAPALAPSLGVGVVAADTPRTADGFARQAAALMATREYPRAIDDWTKALALSPNTPRYLYQRALAELAAQQPTPAMADLDLAVKLDPANIPQLLTRGLARSERGETDKAKADITAAAALADKDPDQRLDVAEAYDAVDMQREGVRLLSLWLAGHPLDDRRAEALNDRCWVSTLLDLDLQQSLADCNAALALDPGNPAYLDSRGLTYVRSGDADRALADYAIVLRLLPDSPWSLYGRGLARLRKGETAQGQADIAAAEKIDPKLAGQAKRYGLTP